LKPLFNRALSAPYTPGSIFKVLDALIGMDQQVITPESRFPCGGGFRLGNHTVRCTHVHSALNLRESLQHSCNPYYCAVFREIMTKKEYPKAALAYQNWYEHIKSFGIGRRLDIDLAHEYPGILKSTTYFDKIYGEGHWKWTNVISLAIGQGEVGITPLQMANVTAAVANKGWFITPHIIKGIGDNMNIPAQFKEKHYTLVDSQYFHIVHDGMQMAVDHGTAFWSRIPDIVMCGKTGTAQNPHGKDHSVTRYSEDSCSLCGGKCRLWFNLGCSHSESDH
jgi:penicillin-binding protein 2